MSHRCINAFLYDNRIYPGGLQVEDDNPILETHAAHFAKVEDSRHGGETTSQAPGETRTPALSDQDVAAWLEAEEKHNVGVWLEAEEKWQGDVVAWLIAEGEATAAAEPAAETEKKQQSRPRGARS